MKELPHQDKGLSEKKNKKNKNETEMQATGNTIFQRLKEVPRMMMKQSSRVTLKKKKKFTLELEERGLRENI